MRYHCKRAGTPVVTEDVFRTGEVGADRDDTDAVGCSGGLSLVQREPAMGLQPGPGQVDRSEGNPMAELPKAAQGTFDELLEGVEPDLAALARRLRAIIRAVDVRTVESVRVATTPPPMASGRRR